MDDHEFAKIHVYQCEKNLFSVGNMLVLVSASESLAYGSWFAVTMLYICFVNECLQAVLTIAEITIDVKKTIEIKI